MQNLNAAGRAPSKPLPTDKWEPTNTWLWKVMLELATGRRKRFDNGQSVIHAPRKGLGFRKWPSGKATAWCVKQYNHLGGNWRPKKGETGKEARVIVAGLAEKLRSSMEYLLADEYELADAREVADYLEANFRFKSPRTPKGQKHLKDEVSKMWWSLKHGTEAHRANVESAWRETVEPHLDDLVRYFSDEGGVSVPKNIQVGSTTYTNSAGLDEAKLRKYAERIEVVLAKIHGWRSKALHRNLTVNLASPRDFRGTVSGKYLSAKDVLQVRASPQILKRDAGYASFEYILVHELGHRFEKFFRLPTDFDKPEWFTSKYSMTESMTGSESFAELFAIGHFGLTGNWDSGKVERFEKLMSTGRYEPAPEVPEHLKNLSGSTSYIPPGVY
jgi:hypothetical protein